MRCSGELLRAGVWCGGLNLTLTSSYRIQPVSYSQVLAYDCQVSQLEADVFPHYRYSSIDYEIQQQPIRALRSYMIQVSTSHRGSKPTRRARRS